MVQISLSQIPPWLSNSLYVRELREKLKEVEFGSDEYNEIMLEQFDVPHFADSSEVNDKKSFLKVYETSKLFIIIYPMSLYYYIYTNTDEVIKFLYREYRHMFSDKKDITYDKKLINSSQGELLNFIYSIEDGSLLQNNMDNISWYAKNELNLKGLPRPLKEIYKFKVDHFWSELESPKNSSVKEYSSTITIKVIVNGIKIACFPEIYGIEYFEELINDLNKYNNGTFKVKKGYKSLFYYFNKENIALDWILLGDIMELKTEVGLSIKFSIIDNPIINIIKNFEEILDEYKKYLEDLQNSEDGDDNENDYVDPGSSDSD